MRVCRWRFFCLRRWHSASFNEFLYAQMFQEKKMGAKRARLALNKNYYDTSETSVSEQRSVKDYFQWQRWCIEECFYILPQIATHNDFRRTQLNALLTKKKNVLWLLRKVLDEVFAFQCHLLDSVCIREWRFRWIIICDSQWRWSFCAFFSSRLRFAGIKSSSV